MDNYLSILFDSVGISYAGTYNGESRSRFLSAQSYHTYLQKIYQQEITNSDHQIIKFSADSTQALQPLSEFFGHVYDQSATLTLPSGILPPGVLYVDTNYLIFERPPCYQNVSVIAHLMDEINYERHRPTLYRLPIPWQIYIVNFVDNVDQDGRSNLYTANVRMLFTKGPVQSFDDEVFLPPLNNFYTNGDLCRPMYDSIDDIERFEKNMTGVIESAYDWVWNSGTNLDLTNCIAQYYYQMRESVLDNTVFSRATEKDLIQSFANHFYFESYYCNNTYVDALYRAWEQWDLHEVSDLRWPNVSVTRSIQHDVHELYSDDLMEYVRERGLVSTDDMHYDEDNDVNYQCGERGCACMGGEDLDIIDFARWAELPPFKSSTLRESLSEFVRQTLPANNQMSFNILSQILGHITSNLSIES